MSTIITEFGAHRSFSIPLLRHTDLVSLSALYSSHRFASFGEANRALWTAFLPSKIFSSAAKTCSTSSLDLTGNRISEANLKNLSSGSRLLTQSRYCVAYLGALYTDKAGSE